jgi:iron complex outermembrane receptor protein
MNTTLPVRLAACLLTSTAALSAQSPAPATARPAASAANETITLEEFSVTESRAGGYRSTTSLTATGIGAKIMDTPVTINVLTEEFLRDTAATEIREALVFVPGIGTNPRNESEFTVRGFQGNISYRNGQYRRQNYTSWNASRVEVLKGPSAIFFGSVRPGGAINYQTTRPELGKRFTDFTATVGSEDYYRAGVFTNVPAGDNLAFRVGAGFLDAHGKAQHDYRRESYLGGSVLWRIHPKHQLVLDVEEVHRNNFMSSSRGYAISHRDYLFNPTVPAAQTSRQWLNSQGRTAEPAFNMFAPIYGPGDPYGRFYAYSADSFEKFLSRAVDLEYLGKIGDSIAWQTQLNYGYDDQPGMRSNNGDTTPFADGRVAFRFEQFENVRDSYNAKNKLTWRYSLGATNHTLQVGHEYQKVVFNKAGFYDSAGRYNGSLLSNVITFRPATDPAPSGYASIAAAGQAYNITRRIDEMSEAYYIVNQSRFFEDKLHTLYGVRNNMLRRRTSYTRPVTNPDTGLGSPEAWTPQVGALYQPRRDISLFAVYSRSMEPNYAIDADGNTAEPIETTGVDVGIKAELMGGRLAGSFTYYQLDRTNLTSRDTDRETATGRTPYFFYGNTHSTEGLELDLNMSPLENYQVIFGWTHYFKAEITESTSPALVGRALTYSPMNTVSLWNRYQFRRGPLAGLSAGIGGRWSESARMSPDPERTMIVPSFTVVDAMLAYNFKVLGRDVRTQLNVKNLTDKEYREGNLGMFAAPRTITLGFSTRL